MSYELFQQGPAAYIPVLLLSLVITVVLMVPFRSFLLKYGTNLLQRKSTDGFVMD